MTNASDGLSLEEALVSLRAGLEVETPYGACRVRYRVKNGRVETRVMNSLGDWGPHPIDLPLDGYFTVPATRAKTTPPQEPVKGLSLARVLADHKDAVGEGRVRTVTGLFLCGLELGRLGVHTCPRSVEAAEYGLPPYDGYVIVPKEPEKVRVPRPESLSVYARSDARAKEYAVPADTYEALHRLAVASKVRYAGAGRVSDAKYALLGQAMSEALAALELEDQP